MFALNRITSNLVIAASTQGLYRVTKLPLRLLLPCKIPLLQGEKTSFENSHLSFSEGEAV